MHFIVRIYYPHKALQVFIILFATSYASFPSLLDTNMGSAASILLIVHGIFLVTAVFWLLNMNICMQKQERYLLQMQLGLLDRR